MTETPESIRALNYKQDLSLEDSSKNREAESNLGRERSMSAEVRQYSMPVPIEEEVETIKNVIISMVMGKSDSLLCAKRNNSISGIVTDKDICYKAVAAGLDIDKVPVSTIMTPSPKTIMDNCRISVALTIMVSSFIRHLPVLSVEENSGSDGSVNFGLLGMLNISSCIFGRLDDLEEKVNENASIISALNMLESRGNINPSVAKKAMYCYTCPDINMAMVRIKERYGSVEPRSVTRESSVREAASLMLASQSTAVAVVDEKKHLIGILTTMDILSRVLSKSLDPETTRVGMVYTSNLETISPNDTVISSLKKMNSLCIKHLPVVVDKTCKAILDVTELAIIILDYLFDASVDPSKKSGGMDSTGTLNNGDYNMNRNLNVPFECFWDNHGKPKKRPSYHNYQGSDTESEYSNESTHRNYQSNKSITSAVDNESYGYGNSQGGHGMIKFRLRIKTPRAVLKFKARYDSLRALKGAVLAELAKCNKKGITDIDISYVNENGETIPILNDGELLYCVGLHVQTGENERMEISISKYYHDTDSSTLGYKRQAANSSEFCKTSRTEEPRGNSGKEQYIHREEVLEPKKEGVVSSFLRDPYLTTPLGFASLVLVPATLILTALYFKFFSRRWYGGSGYGGYHRVAW